MTFKKVNITVWPFLQKVLQSLLNALSRFGIWVFIEGRKGGWSMGEGQMQQGTEKGKMNKF